MLDSSSDANTVDYEHAIQLNLLESLVTAARDPVNQETTKSILDQFVTFSEAHFMAEQLLMRLHAWPQHDEHTKQHDNLIEACTGLQHAQANGDFVRLTTESRQLQQDLLRHIEGSDRELKRFLRASSAQH